LSQRKKEKKKKKKKKKRRRKRKKKKEKRGMLIPHLCFKVAPCFSYRESPMLSLSYTSGNFSL
jgi:hypothetical protein